MNGAHATSLDQLTRHHPMEPNGLTPDDWMRIELSNAHWSVPRWHWLARYANDNHIKGPES